MYYRIILVVILLFFSPFCRGQHVEYNFVAGSGLFHYASDKTDRMEPFYSMINTYLFPGDPPGSYMNDPLGDQSGFSFQFSVAAKKVTRHNFLWGLALEFQSLQSRKKIRYAFDVAHDTILAASGHSSLRNKYIDLFPSFGHRITFKKMYLDVAGGLELAMNFFRGHEKANVEITATHQLLTTDFTSRSSPVFEPFDGRFSLQSLLGYHQWGISIGYSWGLVNMDGIGRTNHSYSRYARVGIVYTLRAKNKSKPN